MYSRCNMVVVYVYNKCENSKIQCVLTDTFFVQDMFLFSRVSEPDLGPTQSLYGVYTGVSYAGCGVSEA